MLILSGLIARGTQRCPSNDPRLRAKRQEVGVFVEGHPGAIDSYERTGV